MPGTNANRADWAASACGAFATLTGCHPRDEAPGDLLCNLLHLLASQGKDPALWLVRAYATYRSECLEPDDLGPEPAVTLYCDREPVAHYEGHR